MLPMVFQWVPIMKINTGLPLGHPSELASACVVPVAFWSVPVMPMISSRFSIEDD